MREYKFRMFVDDRMLYRNLTDRNWYTKHRQGECIKCVRPDDSNFPIMQCIGLADDDNQPIYEGDIVSIKLWKDDLDAIICEVIYEDAAFLLYDEKGGRAYHLSDPFSLMVIGNVHQNRGLLEGK